MIPPRVVVDERERSSGVPDLLSKLEVRVYFSQLSVGDYVINPEIAVERKSLSDFISSVYDGRLFVQASEISSSFRKPYLIVEGDVKEIGNLTKNLNSYYGAVASVTLAYDLRLIHTASPNETAVAIAALTRQSRARPLPPGVVSPPPKGRDEAPAAALPHLLAARGRNQARPTDALEARNTQEDHESHRVAILHGPRTRA